MEGSALPLFSPWQCCSIGEGEIVQGCLQEWLKSCYLCAVRTGDLRLIGSFLVLRDTLESFHHMKWDCVCRDLEICCLFCLFILNDNMGAIPLKCLPFF